MVVCMGGRHIQSGPEGGAGSPGTGVPGGRELPGRGPKI